LGTDGVDIQRGFTAKTEKEAEIAAVMRQQANHSFVLCDARKLNQTQYLQWAALGQINTLITDAPAEIVAPYRAAGLEVVNE
jgi:DeoR/GlpR family transcriptional regulator of sugar metabolism